VQAFMWREKIFTFPQVLLYPMAVFYPTDLKGFLIIFFGADGLPFAPTALKR